MTESVDCLVVGAGVVGLAVARRLAASGREVVLAEAGDGIGSGISARNSEVVHAGIYYPPGSLKAGLCVAGREQLYRFCETHAVPHRRCGKLIVATEPGQSAQLEDILRRGRANGVRDLTWLDAGEARAMEPELRCRAAVYSPSTGIVDAHALMHALLGDAEGHGAMLALRSPVAGGELGDAGISVRTGGEAPMRLRCRALVNCAGLAAQAVAGSLRGLPRSSIPALWLAKGSYFALTGPSPFRRLIYPVPETEGLGVHLTLDMGGRARFGPDVEWLDEPDYAVDPARGKAFCQAIRRYWPGLPDGALRPDYAGVRPKLSPPGEAAADFVIQGPPEHGIPGLVNLYGIESPGLTAALAIADRVAALIG